VFTFSAGKWQHARKLTTSLKPLGSRAATDTMAATLQAFTAEAHNATQPDSPWQLST